MPKALVHVIDIFPNSAGGIDVQYTIVTQSGVRDIKQLTVDPQHLGSTPSLTNDIAAKVATDLSAGAGPTGDTYNSSDVTVL